MTSICSTIYEEQSTKRHCHAQIQQFLQSLGATDTAAPSAAAAASAPPKEHGPSEGERMCMAAAKGRLEEIQRLVTGGATPRERQRGQLRKVHNRQGGKFINMLKIDCFARKN